MKTTIATVAAGLLLGPLAATATPAARELRFLHDPSVGPPLLQQTRPQGEPQAQAGLTMDLNRAIAAELGLQARFVPVPRKRIEAALQQGRADLICYKDPSWFLRPDAVRWSDVYLSNSNLLISGPAATPPASLQALTRGRIGTVGGYRYPELEDVFARAGVQRDDAPDDEANFRKLLAGRTDHLVTHRLFLEHRLREQPAAAARLTGQLRIRDFDTRCALGPRAPVSLEAFDAALRRLRASGAYDDILNRYR